METCAALKCTSPPGTTQCHCGSCHQTFTGVTAFDRHQRITDDGLACLDPETARGHGGRLQFAVWRATADGRPVWGRALFPGETLDGRYERGHDAQGGFQPGPSPSPHPEPENVSVPGGAARQDLF